MHTNDINDDFDNQEPTRSAAPDYGTHTETALGKGLDVGTANLAAAVQNDEGGITVNVERNAFLDINSDVYSKNMLTKLKVPYIVHNTKLVVIGEAAFAQPARSSPGVLAG